jgi:hypothetical protein
MIKKIQYLLPDAEFVLVGNSYEGLDWRDERPKPTLEEIEAVSDEEVELAQWRQSATLSRRRFKIGEAVYKVNGTPLVELIEALLVGLPEPQKTIASISYNESNSFDRLDAFVVQFGQALEMSEEEVDDFFQFCINEGWK